MSQRISARWSTARSGGGRNSRRSRERARSPGCYHRRQVSRRPPAQHGTPRSCGDLCRRPQQIFDRSSTRLTGLRCVMRLPHPHNCGRWPVHSGSVDRSRLSGISDVVPAPAECGADDTDVVGEQPPTDHRAPDLRGLPSGRRLLPTNGQRTDHTDGTHHRRRSPPPDQDSTQDSTW